MSRGPGRIERAIRTLFDANPELAFVTEELCEHCYPGVAVEKRHQVAVLRAARSIIKDDPDWRMVRGDGPGSPAVFCNCANLQSYTLGQAMAHYWNYLSRFEKRERRAELLGRIANNGPGHG